jgi:predicted dehydrogenase
LTHSQTDLPAARSHGAPEARLIINADDFAYFDHVSEGILDCIDAGRSPVVSGEDGLRALETAIRITAMLAPQTTRETVR